MGLRSRIRQIGYDAVDAGLGRAEARIRNLRSGLNSPQPSSQVYPDRDEAASTSWDGRSAPTAAQLGSAQSAAVQGALSQIDWSQEDALDRARGLVKSLDSDSAEGDPKSLYWDPYTLSEQLGYKERPSALTYPTLETMVWRVPLINAIILTRVNQMASFARPQRDQYSYGYRIKLRNGKKHPSRVEVREAERLEAMIQTTGWCEDSRTRPTFENLLRKSTRDLLTYDQVNWEVLPNRKGKPAAWYALDAATIRLADTYSLQPTGNLDAIKCVQIYDQIVINEYTGREIIFEVMNPRSNIRTQGYGTSPIEVLVSTITQLLWAVSYNTNIFSQGSSVPGVINLQGAIPEKQMRAFRREWYQMVSGVENAHRQPIISAEGVQWIPLNASNRDMEFGAWVDFLIKTACAAFLMDPVEINFKYGTSGQRCYAPETEVLMFDGSIRRADEVREGDQLMGPDSTPRNVFGTTSGRAEMFEVRPVRGEPWRCNGLHQLTLVDTKDASIKDIEVQEYLKLPKKTQRRLRLFQPEGVIFPEREAPVVDPYFYGLWVGDGSKHIASQGVMVTTADDEIVRYLEEYAASWGLRVHRSGPYGYRIAKPWGGNDRLNPLREEMRPLWTDGSIPDEFKLGSWETRLGVLAGFLDADGHNKAERDAMTFVQKNHKTAHDIAFIARSLGFRVTLKPFVNQEGSNMLSGYISGPVWAIPTLLPRKQAKEPSTRYGVNPWLGNPMATGFEVVPVGRGEFFGWETDGDHRHLLADFTVSHNSMFGAADKAKMIESRQKGLKPLLQFFEGVINRWLLQPINEDFIFEFAGLESMTPKEQADLTTQQVRSMRTIDELRAKEDLDPLPDGLGNVILDANWLAHMRLQQQQEEQHAQAQIAMGQSVATPAGATKDPGLPSGKPALPGAPSPPPVVDPPVGTLASEKNATPDQLKELERLLRPQTAEKSVDDMDDDELLEKGLIRWEFEL